MSQRLGRVAPWLHRAKTDNIKEINKIFSLSSSLVSIFIACRHVHRAAVHGMLFSNIEGAVRNLSFV